jgi:hypothetical protein
MEEWKSVIGYEGIYEISSEGRLRSLKFGRIRYFNMKPDGWGYQIAALSKNGVRESVRFHRLVAKHFIPNPNNYPTINHIDANKLNNAVSNLEWCTQLENNRHSIKIGGRCHKNEGHPMAKLTNKQVLLIREMHSTGKYKQKELATLFNVKDSHISSIVTNKSRIL